MLSVAGIFTVSKTGAVSGTCCAGTRYIVCAKRLVIITTCVRSSIGHAVHLDCACVATLILTGRRRSMWEAHCSRPT